MKILDFFKSHQQKEENDFNLLPDGIFVLEQDAAIVNELEALAAEVATKASKVELSNGLAQKSDIYHNHNLDYARKDLEHDHEHPHVEEVEHMEAEIVEEPVLNVEMKEVE